MVYNRPIDGLRGLAILLVLLFHFDFLVPFGWVGVQLFFVLSGYLITSILLVEKSKPLSLYLKRFYWRRTLRIFPLYYFYLIAIGVIYSISLIPPDYIKFLPYLSTYTFNLYPLLEDYSYSDYFFMHFWSLSVEEQFYIVWPLVIFLLGRQQLKVLLVLLILLVPFVRYFLTGYRVDAGYSSHYIGETVYRFTLSQWDGFAFGALIPVFGLNNKELNVKLVLGSSLFIVLGVGLWNMVTLVNMGVPIPPTSLGYAIGHVENYQQVWSYSLLNLFFLALVLYCTHASVDKSFVRDKFFSSKIMVYFGKVSYGLYVYHWIIWMAYNKFLTPVISNPYLGFLIFSTVSLGVATISYYVLEKPLLSLKDKYFLDRKT